MIVCLCHRVTDRDIARAVANGMSCFEQLQDEMLVAGSCGCCRDCAREVFEAALTRRGPPAAAKPAPVGTAPAAA